MSNANNAQALFQTVIVTPDGVQHASKEAALAHIRKPQILAALNVVTQNNEELAQWLLANQEGVEVAFESGTIRRVTKSDLAKLKKAVDAVVASGNKEFQFLIDNAGAVVDSFRFPSVKRMDEAEKALAARNSLVALSEGNEQLADWVVANKDAILKAFEAGVVKRTVNEKAAAGLAAYRAKKAEEKAAAEAAKAAAGEQPAGDVTAL